MLVEVKQEREGEVDSAEEKVDKGRTKVLEKGGARAQGRPGPRKEAGQAGSRRMWVNWQVWWWDGE